MKEITLQMKHAMTFFEHLLIDKKNMMVLLSIMAAVIIFDFLFYDVFDLGLNALLMVVAIIPLMIMIHRPSLNNRHIWRSVAMCLFASITFVIHVTGYTTLMYFLSLFIMVGSFQSISTRNIIFQLFQYFIAQVTVPFSWLYFLFFEKEEWVEKSGFKYLKEIKLALIPIVLLLVFMIIYGRASTAFYDVFITKFVNYFSSGINDMNTLRLVVWIISGFLISAALMPMKFSTLMINDSRFKDYIYRGSNTARTQRRGNFNGLNQELKIATMTFVMLNALLLIFNLIDIKYIYMDFGQKSAIALSQGVHEGTNNLILAIILGISLLYFFFRKNLNFHPDNRNLKLLSRVWIIQNAFLAVSVLARNLQYINQYGLTHKRLGVILFIIIVGIGLWFAHKKIENHETLFQSFNRYTLTCGIMLILFGAVNQEKLIIMTSVYVQQENVDIMYLKSLNNESEYLLWKYKDQLNAKSYGGATLGIDDYNHHNTSSGGWREWTFSEWYNNRQILMIKDMNNQ